jgi:hypothetical protein
MANEVGGNGVGSLFSLVALVFGVVCLVPLYAQVFIEENERSTSPRPADLSHSFEFMYVLPCKYLHRFT